MLVFVKLPKRNLDLGLVVDYIAMTKPDKNLKSMFFLLHYSLSPLSNELGKECHFHH